VHTGRNNYEVFVEPVADSISLPKKAARRIFAALDQSLCSSSGKIMLPFSSPLV
jgi:hypothetical protein